MPKILKMRGVTKRSPQQKWDWDFIRALYNSGMDYKEINKLPEFKGLSRHYFDNRIYKEGWSEERKRLNIARVASLGMTFEEKIRSAQRAHYEFLFKQCEEEREIIKSRAKQTDTASQRDRLGLLERWTAISSKALGLEDATPGDRNAQGFKMLVALHQGGAATLAIQTTDATGRKGDIQQVAFTSLQDKPQEGLSQEIAVQVSENAENPVTPNYERLNGVSDYNPYPNKDELIANWRNDPTRTLVNENE